MKNLILTSMLFLFTISFSFAQGNEGLNVMEKKQIEASKSSRSPAGSTKSKSDITSYDGRKTTETDALKELDEQETRDYAPSGNSSSSSGSSNSSESSGNSSGRSTPSLGEMKGGRDD